MKSYSAKIDNWTKSKRLIYFRNFIKNHTGNINDEDVFDVLKDNIADMNWIEFIRKNFSATEIKLMEKNKGYRSSLDLTDPPAIMLMSIWNITFSRKTLRKSIISLIDEYYLAVHPLEKYENESLPLRFAELQKTFELSELEYEIAVASMFIYRNFLEIQDDHSHRTNFEDKAIFIAKCLDRDPAEVLMCLKKENKLRRFNCIDADLDFNRNINVFLTGISDEALTSSYFARCNDEVLPWDFYGKLAEEHGDFIKKIIANSSEQNNVNILLYGAPGTGKSSFAKTLAKQLQKNCFILSQGSDDLNSSDSSADFRFAALQVCDLQLDHDKSIIIVDEADDMLASTGMNFFGMNLRNGDKGQLNTILDNLKTPVIWISNTPAHALDESSRRRFDYSICFKPLSAPQRKSIWENNIRKMQMENFFNAELIDFCASRYEVSAGIITKVLTNIERISPAEREVKETVEKLMSQHCELLEVKQNDDKLQVAKDYSLEGLNIKGDMPLEMIVSAIRKFQTEDGSAAPDRPRMNLLLSGPPGTGKTEFVKYLGSVLNTKVVVKMGSDLLNMYVGGTERNIKNAFAQAETEKAILFLDEIDGLVQNRAGASRSWEVTQVNELLYQMENFNGVMIGATNFMKNLDPAIMRRFTFKIGFDYLKNEGKKIFFERMFNTELANDELARLNGIENLSPGDFRTVRQALYYLENGSNSVRLDYLQQESDAKKIVNKKTKNIGF